MYFEFFSLIHMFSYIAVAIYGCKHGLIFTGQFCTIPLVSCSVIMDKYVDVIIIII